MDITDFILVVIVVFFQLGLRALFLSFFSLLGTLIWKIFICLALGFARMISAFLFVPLFAMIWTFERFFGYNSPSLEPSSLVQTSNNSLAVQASKAGMNGIPKDWVTVRLCGTDEISDFELEDRTLVVTKPLDGMFEGWIGSWEKRQLFVTTRAEIDVKVTSWLDSLDEGIKQIQLEHGHYV
ncbi:hypothetical protein N431DRAFT_419540 [Stipitochalara longipes BDJ]|nr:hypothetical protein N431DRAFT_419540 [Stipitochalara longipes BDJ]